MFLDRNRLWPALLIIGLVSGCGIQPPSKPTVKASTAPLRLVSSSSPLAPEQPNFDAPLALRHYPVNTNQPPRHTNTIALRWNTNQLAGKTAFDVQESHDMRTWTTIQTNVQGDPQVTNSGPVTFWRVVAR